MPLIEIENDHKVAQVGDIVPTEMNDDDLRECMGMLCVEGADIREQLADPTRTGEDWRIRAQDALRHRVREFEACRVEAIRRGMRDLPDIDPKRESARLNRVAEWDRHMAAIAARATAKAAGVTAGQRKHEADIVLARQQTEYIRAGKTARTLAYIKAENEAFQGKAACFVAAARKVMTVEQRRAVWDRAREMFPDDPCWNENREETSR